MKMIMKNEKQEQTIEKAQGRAMLRWDGKKPLERIEYFPAQEKEVYGDKSAKDFNKLFWGDNLQVLAHLLKEYRGKIDLIYIDPPFDSEADYVKKVKIKGAKVDGVQGSFIEEKQYTDIWGKDEYLQFMYERLILLRELMSEKGSIYLHCDWRKVHHLRCLMDEVFGEDNIRNEIIWRCGRMGEAHTSLPTAHNTILHYSKTDKWKWKHPRVPYAESLLKSLVKDENGWYYTRGAMGREMAEWEVEQGVGLKTYVDIERGKAADDVWDDVGAYASGLYPTQKPEKLLARIIECSSEVGDTVLDCFMGSGTTMVAAQKMGRRWIGCDINIGSIQTTTKRLNQVLEAQTSSKKGDKSWLLPDGEISDAKACAGFAFKTLNVNEYDVFKNELEAKDIILEMYGVERARMGYFDGMLDNNFVKIMPINRVCSKKDIDEVLKGIKDNLGDFTAKTKSRHGESVYQQGVGVFCSGMELDMFDYLKKNNATGVDVEVRDILLDKQTLIFKQRPEAEITVKAGDKQATVKINDFISPILMRKLEIENGKSLKQESKAKVDDYRQVIDSIAIDADYDGSLFNAEIIDVPVKKDLIKGEYVVEYEKKGKNTIAIKIVDVLGEEYFESFEVTV